MKITGIILLFLCLQARAQHQERTVFVYNLAFAGLSSGIGSVINKPKDVNWKKAFFRGLCQGSIGGLIDYSGKKTLYLVNKNQQDLYAWPAKFLHATGYSLIRNAAEYEPFLQNWSMDLGLVRFDFSFATKKLRARLLPEALIASIVATRYGRFDPSTSMETGEIIFKSYNGLIFPGNFYASGTTIGRVVIYTYGPQAGYTKERILSHEIVHRFQYNEYQVFNSRLQPVYEKSKSKTLKKIFSRYVYADIPYLWLPYYTLYGIHKVHYYKNFYEFEAERFSTNAEVAR